MSSSEVAVRVQGVSKCYQIYESPRDRLKQFVVPRVQRLIGVPPGRYYREFWALNDVSLDVKRGETVGIIGQNGSGKSTLLQIICGTVAPTSGVVETSGRIGALLELGSGFNPEFTGRENVYLNAAVLGLSKNDIEQRFDDIARFADIGQFIDQPVKFYSSGMYVRLAFAVIAHIDADILVIDEALSVGDALFTQKCMRFIRSFQEAGTLVFVSHDTAAVQNLCEKAVWLADGRVRQVGGPRHVAEKYLHYTAQQLYGDAVQLTDLPAAGEESISPGAIADTRAIDLGHDSVVSTVIDCRSGRGWKSGAAEIISVTLEKLGTASTSTILAGGEKVRMVVRAKAHQELSKPILGFLVRDRLGQDLFGENTLPYTATAPQFVATGQEFEGEFVFRLPMLPNGDYAVMVSVADGDLHRNVQHHWIHDAILLRVSSSKIRWGLVGVPFERVSLRVLDA